jgi:hypothetical protein
LKNIQALKMKHAELLKKIKRWQKANNLANHWIREIEILLLSMEVASAS